VRQEELTRYAHRLEDLTDDQREVVESLTRGILAKLLHSPSIQLKDAAGTPQGDRLSAAVRDLFGLQ
jgi:glutamyl-tRNA reductase